MSIHRRKTTIVLTNVVVFITSSDKVQFGRPAEIKAYCREIILLQTSELTDANQTSSYSQRSLHQVVMSKKNLSQSEF